VSSKNNQTLVRVLIVAISLLVFFAVSNSGRLTAMLAGTSYTPLDDFQKHRAEQLTNLFENGSFDFGYSYVEALGDGRGITAGRAGFTTATGDLLAVVKEYTRQKPDNTLTKFIPRLQELYQERSNDQEGLDGFFQDWKTAAQDPVFRKAQDAISDQYYYQPAVQYSNDLGLHSALARAAVYDTIIQHGGGDDPDGLLAILKRTHQSVGGTPKEGVDEKVWLDSFLTERQKTLTNPDDDKTRDVWRVSAGRCDVFRTIANRGNYDLQGVIVIDSGGYNTVLGIE
jgi:chitosanase